MNLYLGWICVSNLIFFQTALGSKTWCNDILPDYLILLAWCNDSFRRYKKIPMPRVQDLNMEYLVELKWLPLLENYMHSHIRIILLTWIIDNTYVYARTHTIMLEHINLLKFNSINTSWSVSKYLQVNPLLDCSSAVFYSDPKFTSELS